ncbi:MAG: phage tail protein [Providencia alcalifaciens]|jgi:hypothetical protein|nr:phage tail protein [Providencia alcalifaciens]
MASVITLAFEGWKAQEAASGKPVLLNEFVFANVPNLDPIKPIDRNEKLPPANQIVHRQAVNKAGLASENAVAYSVTLGAEIGDFDFNWIGLINKESGIVAMITHAPLQKKLKTQNGQQGNVLIRSFLLEFNGAAEETQIKTTAETWQIDFTARLSGIDEMQRLINVDNYGGAAFFNDGFEVTRNSEQFTVKKGLGYVGGLRGELQQNQILSGLRNTKVYADFSYQGNIVSKWNTVVKITAAATLSNYVDAAGFAHQVFAIASIDASGNVKDLRPKGALNDQALDEFRKQTKLDLNGKVDKEKITQQKGNSKEHVVSQDLFTSEVGKLATTGDLNTKFNEANNNANSRVPSTRKVNNKALNADITLNASDVGAIPIDIVGRISNGGKMGSANKDGWWMISVEDASTVTDFPKTPKGTYLYGYGFMFVENNGNSWFQHYYSHKGANAKRQGWSQDINSNLAWVIDYNTAFKPSADDVGALTETKANELYPSNKRFKVHGNETQVLNGSGSHFLFINDAVNSGVYGGTSFVWGFNKDGLMTSGLIPTNCGGTGARDVATARSNLQVYSKVEVDAKIVSAVRLGSEVSVGRSINFSLSSGEVITGLTFWDTGSNSAVNFGGYRKRAIQYYLNGTWVNAASV